MYSHSKESGWTDEGAAIVDGLAAQAHIASAGVRGLLRQDCSQGWAARGFERA